VKKEIIKKFLSYIIILLFCGSLIATNLQIRTLRADVNYLRMNQEINWAKIQEIITTYQNTIKDITSMFKHQLRQNKLQKDLNAVLIESVEHISKHALPPSYEKLKIVNYLISNTIEQTQGSGTLIKIDKKYYILTCAHLLKDETDFIWATNTISRDTYPIELIKIDKTNDLALFRIYLEMFEDISKIEYLNIAKEEPLEGDTVYIIGNPGLWTDILTSGIIAQKQENSYFITAPIFFGNSGGAVIYKGEITGVAIAFNSQAQFMGMIGDWRQGFFPYTVDIILAVAVDLETIKKFLEGV
jgi:S1-C subfamily serine protease